MRLKYEPPSEPGTFSALSILGNRNYHVSTLT